MKKETRIPTILGLFLLLVSLFGGVYLTSQNQNWFSKASTDCRPQNPQVTNITHNSADISFFTQSDCSSIIKVNGKNIPNHFSPDSGKVKTHYFRVNDLKEKTKYSFEVIIGGSNYLQADYSFTTASKPIGNIPSSNLAWGRVFHPDLTPAKNAIVYLNIPGASPLSSPVTSNGYWNISLASSFNADKNNWFPLGSDIQEDIVVISSDGQTTQITSHSSRNNPVPDIIIGQNSFSQSPPLNTNVGSIAQPTLAQSSKKLEIINPSDNETINTTQPQFFGSAPPSAEIIIKVESPQTINSQTTASSDGTWNWTPPSNLSPGQHTITVSTKDPQTGIWQSVVRQFTVLAADSDSAPSFSASSSATPIVPSPTKTIPSPTKTLAPTSIPALSQTLIPTATTLTSAPTATSSTMPVAGNSSPTLAFIIFSIPLIALSLHLFTKSGKFN